MSQYDKYSLEPACVGCGCGEVLVRLSERYRIQGIGIDSSSECITEAKRPSKARIFGSQVDFIEVDARTFHVEPMSLELAICMGATHASGFGTDAYRNAISKMLPLVAPGDYC